MERNLEDADFFTKLGTDSREWLEESLDMLLSDDELMKLVLVGGIVLSAILVASIAVVYRYYRQMKNDATNKQETAGEVMKAAAENAKAIAMLLKANRYIPKGISDDQWFRKKPTDSFGDMSNPFRLNDASGGVVMGNVVEPMNLAVLIGVDSEATKGAHEDVMRLKNFFESQGTYKVACMTTKSLRPSTQNIASVVKQIQDAHRPWKTVVLYVAAPCRTAPVEWIDAQRFVSGKRIAATTGEGGKSSDFTPEVQFTSHKKQPRYLFEFMSDEETSSNEQTWVDLGLLLKRLRMATNNAKEAENPLCLLLDAKYDPKGCEEAVRFMNEPPSGDNVKELEAALKATSSSGKQGGKDSGSFAEDPAFRIPEALMDYLRSLDLPTAVERLISKLKVECVVIGGERMTGQDIAYKKKSKVKESLSSLMKNATAGGGGMGGGGSVGGGAALSIDSSCSLLVRGLLEGTDSSAIPEDPIQIDPKILANISNSTSSSLPIPVCTLNTSTSVFHKCIGSPVSTFHYLQNKNYGSTDTAWHKTLFYKPLCAAFVEDQNCALFESSSMMPYFVPATPVGIWKTARNALRQSWINKVLGKASAPPVPESHPLSWIRVKGPHGSGKSTLIRHACWHTALLKQFSSGVVWVDLADYSPLRLTDKVAAPLKALKKKTSNDPKEPFWPAKELFSTPQASSSMFSPDSVFIDVVATVSAALWSSASGVNDIETAEAIFCNLLAGCNAMVVLDNYDPGNTLHSKLAEMLQLGSKQTRMNLATKAMQDEKEGNAPSYTGIYNTVVTTIETTDEASAKESSDATDDGVLVCVPPTSGEEEEFFANYWVAGADSLPLDESNFAPENRNFWVYELVRGTAGVASNEQRKELLAAVEATKKEAAAQLNKIVEMAVAVAASSAVVSGEVVRKTLLTTMTYRCLTGCTAAPVAAIKFLTDGWHDHVVFPVLGRCGLLATHNSQLPRRQPLGQGFALGLELNPALLRSYLWTQQLFKEEAAAEGASAVTADTFHQILASIARSYVGVTFPPIFNRPTMLVQKDLNLGPVLVAVMNAMCLPSDNFWSIPNLVSRHHRMVSVGCNLGFLSLLAQRLQDKPLACLLESAPMTIHTDVADAVKEHLTQCPARPRGALSIELVTVLRRSLNPESEAYKMLFVSLKKEDDASSKKEVSSEGEGQKGRKGEDTEPLQAKHLNHIQCMPVFYETPVEKREYNLKDLGLGDDSSEEEDEDEKITEEETKMKLEALQAQPQYPDFCVELLSEFNATAKPEECEMPDKELPSASAHVSSAAFVEDFLFVGFSDGTLQKRCNLSGQLLASTKSPHDGKITNIIAYPPDTTNPDSYITEHRLVTACSEKKSIVMWSDLNLVSCETVSDLKPPPAAPKKFGKSFAYCNVAAILSEPGVSVPLKCQEQLQFQRDMDYAKFVAVYGENHSQQDMVFDRKLRQKVVASKKANTVVVSFKSQDTGDSVEWNQHVLFGKHPEEQVGCCCVTIGSAAEGKGKPPAPLKLAVAGSSGETNALSHLAQKSFGESATSSSGGHALLFTCDGNNGCRIYAVMNYAVGDNFNAKVTMPAGLVYEHKAAEGGEAAGEFPVIKNAKFPSLFVKLSDVV